MTGKGLLDVVNAWADRTLELKLFFAVVIGYVAAESAVVNKSFVAMGAGARFLARVTTLMG